MGIPLALGLGPEGVEVDVSIGTPVNRVRAQHHALGPEPSRPSHLRHRPFNLDHGDHGHGYQSFGIGLAEVEEPVVVGTAVGLGDIRLPALGLPAKPKGGIQDGHVYAVLVQHLDPLVGVHGALHYALFVGDHSRSEEGDQVLVDGADPAQGAALQEQPHRLLPVNRKILQPLVILRELHGQVTVLGIDVPLPEVGGLGHVGVGVYYRGIHTFDLYIDNIWLDAPAKWPVREAVERALRVR